MRPMREKPLSLFCNNSQTSPLLRCANQLLIQNINLLLNPSITRIVHFQKETYHKTKGNQIHQTMPNNTYKLQTVKKLFIVGQQDSQISQQDFATSMRFSMKKFEKFQRNLLLLVLEFIEILNSFDHKIVFCLKDHVSKILLALQEFVNTGHKYSIQQTFILTETKQKFSTFLKELSCFIPSWASTHLHSILKKFVIFFNIQIKRIIKIENELKMFTRLYKDLSSDQEKFKILNKMNVKQQKIILATLLQQKILRQELQTQTCLSCEAKVKTKKMLTHLSLCRSKTDIQEQIFQLDGQIIAKIYDLNSELMNAKNIMREKLKQINQKIKLESSEKIKKSKKQFYGNTLLSKTFGDSSQQDSESSHSVQSSKGASKKIEELTLSQLSTYINIIEQIQNIGGKIKSQRAASGLGLDNEIFTIKNMVFNRFSKLNVKSPLINNLLNLLIARRDYMRKLKKSISSAKQSGIRFTEEIFFQNQYEDIVKFSNKNKKKRKHLAPSQRNFSEEQTPSVSNQNQYKQVSLRDFLILGYLGKGQYGQILLVKKKQTGIKYAMKKVLIKDVKKRNENIQNQFMTLSIVNSEFIVKTLFSFPENDYHYFVMQYMPNGDFFQLLQFQNRLYQSEAKLYLAEIATGINDLHKVGIVHRDIKPQNILISKSGHIKISDFGLSQPGIVKKQKLEQKKRMMTQFVREEIFNKQITIDRSRTKIVGSPYFMSPEVLSGESALTMSDWWSFGILIFEVLIGVPPFVGQGFDQIVQKVLERKIWPQNIRFGKGDDQISYEAKDFIQKLLTQNPQTRLGQDFQDIKNHPFFYGIDWNNLLSITPYFQFQDQIQQFGEGKQMSEKASSFRSTNPDLKLIRKDILIQQTQMIHYQKEKEMLKVKKFIQKLRKGSM